MYVTACVTLRGVDGSEDDYEVGADVDYESSGPFIGYEVGEPDISAPNCLLRLSRIAHDPQAGGVFCDGWSAVVQEALIEAYVGKLESMREDAADYAYERMKEED